MLHSHWLPTRNACGRKLCIGAIVLFTACSWGTVKRGGTSASVVLTPFQSVCSEAGSDPFFRVLPGTTIQEPQVIYAVLRDSSNVIASDGSLLDLWNSYRNHAPDFTASVHRFTVDPSNPDRIWRVDSGGLSESLDRGRTWRFIVVGPGVSGGGGNGPLVDGRYFIGAATGSSGISFSSDGKFASAGPYFTLDGGRTFRAPPITTAVQTLSSGPYVFAFDWLTGYVSSDGGMSWMQLARQGLRQELSFNVQVDPKVPNTLYYASGGNSGTWFGISRDRGQNWTQISSNWNTVVDRLVSGVIYEPTSATSMRVSFNYGTDFLPVDLSQIGSCKIRIADASGLGLSLDGQGYFQIRLRLEDQVPSAIPTASKIVLLMLAIAVLCLVHLRVRSERSPSA
jgi:hypothetical protein